MEYKEDEINESCIEGVNEGIVVKVKKVNAGINWNTKILPKISGMTRALQPKYPKVVCVLITNLLAHKNKDVALIYSREKEDIPNNYNRHKFTYRSMLQSVDWLEKEGYVINTIAKRDMSKGRKEVSTIKATDKLHNLFNSCNKDCTKTVKEDNQLVILRDERKKLRGYKENQLTESSRVKLQYYNSFIRNFFIEDKNGEEINNVELVRIFNEELGYTGRLYRSDVEVMSKEDRKLLTINGEPIVELDYANLHLRVLSDMYNCSHMLEGIEDAYEYPLSYDERVKENRSAIKLVFNMMLNCKSKAGAYAAVNNKQFPKHDRVFGVVGVWKGKEIVDKILEAFHWLHLETILWKGKPLAYKLQRIDSDMALEILCLGVDENIPVLPIHDSFITTEDNKLWLQDVMQYVYRSQMNKPDARVPISVSERNIPERIEQI